MSTVGDVVVAAGGTLTAVACTMWAGPLVADGVVSVDGVITVVAALLAAVLGAWYGLSACVLLLARAFSCSRRWSWAAGTLRRGVGRWGAPLLRRAAVAGAGLALGMSPAWGSVEESPQPTFVEASGVPVDLRPGFAEPAATDAAAEAASYVVEPGDSLWSISADALGPHATEAQIAAEWPRWYQTNRATIGADPDLIHPGQQLLAPEPKDKP